MTQQTTLQKSLEFLKPYLTIATLYMISDVIYDYGLLRLSAPMGEILYFGRYVAVISYYFLKFCKDKGIATRIRNQISSFCYNEKRREKNEKK